MSLLGSINKEDEGEHGGCSKGCFELLGNANVTLTGDNKDFVSFGQDLN